MVMGLKICSLSNPGSNQRPFDHWPTSLPTALTGPAGEIRRLTRSRKGRADLIDAVMVWFVRKREYVNTCTNFVLSYMCVCVHTVLTDHSVPQPPLYSSHPSLPHPLIHFFFEAQFQLCIILVNLMWPTTSVYTYMYYSATVCIACKLLKKVKEHS
jgi:hypothetical protein